jgi:hypothetical protein
MSIFILFKDMMRELDIADVHTNAIHPGWKESCNTMPVRLKILDESEYSRCCRIAKLDAQVITALASVTDRIKQSRALKALFYHAHCKLAYHKNFSFNDWPDTIPLLGKDSGLFYLLTGLSLIDVWTENFRKQNIPEKYAHDCATWLRGALELYRSYNNNYPGMRKRQLYWLRHYANCELFRCGRFEYMNQELPAWCPVVFRRKRDGLPLAMFQSGISLNTNGFCLYEDQAEADVALVTELIATDSYTEGTPVLPTGTAEVTKRVRLDHNDWEQVLSPGDFTPGIHIPAGGGMLPTLCHDSLRQADAFYKQYIPKQKVKAFICVSWIFSPDYERMLPDSNLAKLMRETYLFPYRSTGRDGMFFIFGEAPEDHSKLPRDNSIRRAMLDILDSNKRLRLGGMLFLPGDIENFGSQHYRQMFKIPENVLI